MKCIRLALAIIMLVIVLIVPAASLAADSYIGAVVFGDGNNIKGYQPAIPVNFNNNIIFSVGEYCSIDETVNGNQLIYLTPDNQAFSLNSNGEYAYFADSPPDDIVFKVGSCEKGQQVVAEYVIESGESTSTVKTSISDIIIANEMYCLKLAADIPETSGLIVVFNNNNEVVGCLDNSTGGYIWAMGDVVSGSVDSPDPDSTAPTTDREAKERWIKFGEDFGIPIIIGLVGLVGVIVVVIILLKKKPTPKPAPAPVPEPDPDPMPRPDPWPTPDPTPRPVSIPVPDPIPPDDFEDSFKSYYIKCSGGYFDGKVFPVDKREILFGRADNCFMQYPPEAKGVSRVHCKLYKEGEQLKLMDLDSSFGTYKLNGDKLEKLVPNKAVSLKNGDVFYLATKKNAFTIQRPKF